jgi:hypothetical protein
MAKRKPKALTLDERKAIILDVLLDQFNYAVLNKQRITRDDAVAAVSSAWRSRAHAINAYVNPKT